MPPVVPAAPLDSAVALFERAIGYTRLCLQLVTPGALGNPTPCAEWDLRALLHHMDGSLSALQEAGRCGYVALDGVPSFGPDRGPDAEGDVRDTVARLRARACALLADWSRGDREQVSIAGRPMAAAMLADAGALEVAVHGWDVARSAGVDRPLPSALAADLLQRVPALVDVRDRPARFATPVRVPASAPAADRLLALLGRRP